MRIALSFSGIMVQMYEVFIGHCSLRFQTEKYLLEVESHCQFIDDLSINPKDLLGRTSEQSLQMILITKDPSESLVGFASRYPLIKAAGALVKSSTGKYLFIHRRGWWDLPKGKIESGESPLQAALRETEEETGLTHLQAIAPMPPTYHMYLLKDQVVLKQTFWYAMEVDGEPETKPDNSEDITEAKWVESDQLPSITSASYSAIRNLVDSWI